MEASTQSSLCEGLCSVTNVLLGCPLQSELRIQPSKINWMKLFYHLPLQSKVGFVFSTKHTVPICSPKS